MNLFAVISVHWKKKVWQLIISQSGSFILPPWEKEYAICSNAQACSPGRPIDRSWGRERSVFICSLVR